MVSRIDIELLKALYRSDPDRFDQMLDRESDHDNQTDMKLVRMTLGIEDKLTNLEIRIDRIQKRRRRLYAVLGILVGFVLGFGAGTDNGKKITAEKLAKESKESITK